MRIVQQQKICQNDLCQELYQNVVELCCIEGLAGVIGSAVIALSKNYVTKYVLYLVNSS